jgi:thioredoxin 1
MGEVTSVTGQTWEQEVLKAQGAVMVDFWAPWCGPCKMTAPIVEDLAREYAGKIKICKLNTDENPDIGSRYQIMGIPSLLFFKEGVVKDKIVGAVSKKALQDKIDSVIA